MPTPFPRSNLADQFRQASLPTPDHIDAKTVAELIKELNTESGRFREAGNFHAGERLVYALTFDPKHTAVTQSQFLQEGGALERQSALPGNRWPSIPGQGVLVKMEEYRMRDIASSDIRTREILIEDRNDMLRSGEKRRPVAATSDERVHGERLVVEGKISGPHHLINALFSAIKQQERETGKSESPAVAALWGAAAALYEREDRKNLELALQKIRDFPPLPADVRELVPEGLMVKAKSFGYRY